MDTITLGKFCNNVETVTSAGGVVTDEYDRILDRWTQFNETIEAPLEAFTGSLVGEASQAELHQLYGLSLAHLAGTTTHATVRNAGAAAVEARLRAEYRTVAQANYETVADRFDAVAGELAQCVAAVNPQLSTEQLVKLSKDKQKAWLDIKGHSLQLDGLLASLHAAGYLAGITPEAASTELLIPLTVDLDGMHYRRIWEAWHTEDTHGGRWAALLLLGATIRAHDFARVRPRQLRPIETRYKRVEFGHTPVHFDPEDPNADHDTLTPERTAAALSAR